MCDRQANVFLMLKKTKNKMCDQAYISNIVESGIKHHNTYPFTYTSINIAST
jgi:hypothetical protein